MGHPSGYADMWWSSCTVYTTFFNLSSVEERNFKIYEPQSACKTHNFKKKTIHKSIFSEEFVTMRHPRK